MGFFGALLVMASLAALITIIIRMRDNDDLDVIRPQLRAEQAQREADPAPVPAPRHIRTVPERTYHIRYLDAAGDESSRTITLHAIERLRDHYLLHAYCHMRRRARHFRADRILELADASTGEVLDPETLARQGFAEGTPDVA